MGADKKINSETICKWAFGGACAALPWIDMFPVCTYLFIFSAIPLLFTSKFSKLKLKTFLNVPSALFILFYAFQLVGYFIKPYGGNDFALEQKASLIFLPLLLSAVIQVLPAAWYIGIKGFIAGVFAACLYCLVYAVYHYTKNQDASFFLYHQYSSAVNKNAIYLSLHILICMCMLVFYNSRGIIKMRTAPLIIFLFFLYGNIILLSSRIAIFSGSLMLLYMLFSILKSKVVRFASAGVVISLLVIIAATSNPVKDRFDHIKTIVPEKILNGTDFTNYNFNGLDLRILFWRMAVEVLNENNSWLTGLGARSYHETLNQKMYSYHLFAGDEKTKDSGYINMDLHNQYMENLIQFGIPGLLLLLSVLSFIFYQAISKKNIVLLLIVLIFSISFFTESLLETQSGLLLFMTFVYGEWFWSSRSGNIIRR